MTKAELIARIARNRDLPPDLSKKVIAKIVDLAFAELSAYFVRSKVTRAQNPRFTFPKFGTFTKKRRSGRRGVNPRTLEPMDIEACETIDFKPSEILKRQLNEATLSKGSARTRAAAKTTAASKATSKTRRKKAARSSAKTKTKAKRGRSAGPGGRKLVTREEADLELPSGEPLLPDAPLQRTGRRRRSKLGNTGS